MDLHDVRLETPRLVLREKRDDDVAAILRWASDAEVVRLVQWGPNDEAMTRAYLEVAKRAREAEPRVDFELGITLRGADELVGACGLRIVSHASAHGDLGYTLRRDLWGQGYATEAARALVDFGVDVLHLHRIWATCHVDNAASARVLEKIGMRREGRLRENVKQRDGWRDSWLYALLASDVRNG